jgi:UDP-glucose:(heptosyl)LPS alpha-1,3-glucosyltransferase
MKMRFAFCLFRYFPFGGLQRDFLRIAQACLKHGHEIDVYTTSWQGPQEKGLNLHIIPVKGWQNHIRTQRFAIQVQEQLQKKYYDVIVGFNRIPGIDIYYAADVCLQALLKQRGYWWRRFLPRYRQYLAAEAKVFTSNTEILVLSAIQQLEYHRCYQTPLQRFHLLPPGISPDRIAPANAADIREEIRNTYHITHQSVLLLVGSGFKTKGLDRAILGLAALPADVRAQTRLWVVGQDNPGPFIKLARKLNVSHLITFLGGRHDVNRFFLGADLLVHPARHENTGTVLLEAVAAGLPVLTVDACGYAHYIKEANAGKVLSSPFNQSDFNALLQTMLVTAKAAWQHNAINFAKSADIYSLPEKAAEYIENFASRKAPRHPEHVSHPEPASYQDSQFIRIKDSIFECLYKKSLPELPQKFCDYMAMKGEVFREQKGRKTQRIVLNNKAYFIKQHLGVGWLEIIKNLLQLRLPVTGAKNEWQAIQRLQELAIHTPTVVAYGSCGINPATRLSFLLMEELAPTISLEDFCREWPTIRPPFSLKKQLLLQVAHIARIMHNHGINHRDFYICHFLLKWQQSLPKLYLIDLHRAGLHRRLRARWIIKDLAGLYFSSKNIGLTQHDLFRFLKAYRNQPLRNIMATESQFWQKVYVRGEKLHDAHGTPA